MNRRQKKKNWKKQAEFITSFVSSYKELKEFDRTYHKYMLQCKRRQKLGTNKELIAEF